MAMASLTSPNLAMPRCAPRLDAAGHFRAAAEAPGGAHGRLGFLRHPRGVAQPRGGSAGTSPGCGRNQIIRLVKLGEAEWFITNWVADDPLEIMIIMIESDSIYKEIYKIMCETITMAIVIYKYSEPTISAIWPTKVMLGMTCSCIIANLAQNSFYECMLSFYKCHEQLHVFS